MYYCRLFTLLFRPGGITGSQTLTTGQKFRCELAEFCTVMIAESVDNATERWVGSRMQYNTRRDEVGDRFDPEYTHRKHFGAEKATHRSLKVASHRFDRYAIRFPRQQAN
jgi:hypothetical protein